jgi:hypothetical protein
MVSLHSHSQKECTEFTGKQSHHFQIGGRTSTKPVELQAASFMHSFLVSCHPQISLVTQSSVLVTSTQNVSPFYWLTNLGLYFLHIIDNVRFYLQSMCLFRWDKPWEVQNLLIQWVNALRDRDLKDQQGREK